MEKSSGNYAMCTLAAMTLALSACAHDPAENAESERAAVAMELEDKARVPGEYLVSLVPESSETAILDRYGEFGIAEVTALGEEIYLLVLSRDPGPRVMAELVQDDFRFRGVQANIIYWTHRPPGKHN